MSSRHALSLTKHHGLGNDFLVLLGPPDDFDAPAVARAICDRHLGIGADGLLVASRDPLAMLLLNADGTVAEMSGNGIRCFAQAVVDAGWRPQGAFDVVTGAGVRSVDVAAEDDPGLRLVRVEMGPAKVVRDDDADGRVASVETGNPHLVRVVDDLASVDLVALGARHPDVNVEVARVDDRSNVTMRVHERGVGLTEACGTGSCAVVAATVAWGLTDRAVQVHNPGGTLGVELVGDDAYLTGPTQFVAKVEWPCH